MEGTTANPKIKEQTVCMVRDYLKNLVKANALPQEQLVETIAKLKKPEEIKIQLAQKDRLLTKKEVAEILLYKHPRTVDRMEKKGLLKRVELGHGVVRFRLSDTNKLVGLES